MAGGTAVLLLGLVLLTAPAEAHEVYTESMRVDLLPDGDHRMVFNLSVEAPWGCPADPHAPCHFGPSSGVEAYQFLPRHFVQVASYARVKQMQMTLARGRWSQLWGRQAVPATSVGASLGVSFVEEGGADNSSRWRVLVDHLSGMLCASLGFLDPDAQPIYARGTLLTRLPSVPWHRWGFLPSEEQVCTENLTPLLSLMPSKGTSGIAAVLNTPRRLFTSKYHTLNLILSTRGDAAVLSVVVEAVFPTSTAVSISTGKKRITPCLLCKTPPRITFTAHPTHVSHPGFKLTTLGLEELPGGSATRKDYEVPLPTPGQPECDLRWGWDPTPLPGELRYELPPQPAVDFYVQEVGDQQGSLTVRGFVPGGSAGRLLVLLPTHYLLPYIHKSETTTGNGRLWTPLIYNRNASVQVDESSANTLALIVEWTHSETFAIKIPYDKRILPLEMYPPDANRLYTFPPSALWYSDESPPLLSTRPVGTTMPTPDFSMPFNVITLSCTAAALLYGAIFKFAVKDIEE